MTKQKQKLFLFESNKIVLSGAFRSVPGAKQISIINSWN